MIKKQFTIIFIFGLIILGVLSPEPVLAQSPGGSSLRILSTGSGNLVLELTIPEFRVETIEQGGQTYHRLLIPDTVQKNVPGAPQLPTRGTMIGIGTPENVFVEVLDAEVEVLSGYQLFPAPILEVVEGDVLADPKQTGLREIYAPDPAIYTNNAFYPTALVEIGETGYIRDQAVAQLQFHPVQTNPVSGEVRLYRRLVVRVSWPASSLTPLADGRLANPAYEKLLKTTLLNYEMLNRPEPVEEPPPSVPDSIVATDTTPRLKIKVTSDAIYRLTPTELTQAGFQLAGVDSRTIKINNRGSQIPIYLVDSNNNNLFDDNDYLLFYGTAIADIYTNTNVYWLEAGGNPGARMNPISGSGTSTTPASFPATLHVEEDSFYWSGKGSGGLDDDHWFWGNRITSPNSQSFTITVNNVASSDATLRVNLKGRTGGSHRTEIYLNGVLVSTQSWNGQVFKNQEAAVSNLQNGNNTVTVKATVTNEQIHVNFIEVDYSDTYVAENNSLFFRAPAAGSYQFNVSNFGNNNIKVFDVTDPDNVAIVSNTVVSGGGSNYSVTFKNTASTSSRYLATATYPSPNSLKLDQASDWKNVDNRADYVIITHEDFSSAASNLADHRRNSGLEVVVVKIDDIYDEFNYGIFNPKAIQDFLKYSLSWNKVPTYVLLLGGATYDYRDLLSFSRKNYVPTQLIELGADDPRQDVTISDNWFVLVSGADVLPDMYIGRLAAQSSSEADVMVNKIISYDQSPPTASWNQHVLLVADHDPSNLSNSITYELTSDSLANRLPADFTANKVYQREIPDPKPEIIDDLNNNGSILVNYAGHGSVNTWTSRILTTSDIQGLTNSRWPVVTVANCLNGYFVDKVTSVSEEFQRRPNTGAVAAWAPSSIGYPTDHRVMVEQFYDAVFQYDYYELGEIATTAKLEAYGLNNALDMLVETYVFFGDPAQTIGIPQQSPPPPNPPPPPPPPNPPPGDVKVFLPAIVK